MTRWLRLMAVFCSGCASTGSPWGGVPVADDGLPMSEPAEYAGSVLSAKAGEEYFGHAGSGDPYATGMAYPVFLALMQAYPEELGRDWNDFAERFGFIADPQRAGDPQALPVGFHLTTDPNTGVPWLVGNCQVCHAERLRLPAGDVVVTGMGSTRARPHAYVSSLVNIGRRADLREESIEALAAAKAEQYGVPWPALARKPIVKASLRGLRALAAKGAAQAARFDVALPGRVATIESFALKLEAEGHAPVPTPETVGWAKIPDVVGFPYRETFSFDAATVGSPQALVLEADFLFGTRPKWYLSHPQIATDVYLYLRSFRRKLAYPGSVDATLAAQGKEAFDAKCAGCHGLYVDRGGETAVSYQERVVPAETVGTDRARLDAVSPQFVAAANAFPLTRGYTQTRNSGGYVPPVLLNVWARGLLGHAGQWPSIEVLATPPDRRPHQFIVATNGTYDLERFGVRYEAIAAPRALRPGEYLYDGDKPGYGVAGHPFLSRLGDADRRAVVEYLKTL
jgi:mono/diheme cytochrome c family protein